MYSTEEYLEEAMLTENGHIQDELEKILKLKAFSDEMVVITEFKRFIK